jgi:transcription elongation factor GreA
MTMAEQKIYEMTVEGIRKLQEELELRKIDRRTEIAERIRQARSFGDLSENSEYDDAKNAQAENEARIMELETVLKNARAIEDDDISKTRVTVGSVVTIRNEEFKEEETYTLVGPKEEDILSGKLSSESPVGNAIMGKKKGTAVEVKTPMGTLKYKVVKIAKPS